MTHFNLPVYAFVSSLVSLLVVYEATVLFHFSQPCYINIEGHLLYLRTEPAGPL
jgi:hypothetical protein